MDLPTPLYDAFSREYDVMVSWPERLRRETPFLVRELGEAKGRRVLDIGCGTGHHAIHLADLGFEVVGADPSAEMIARAERNAAGRPNVRFVRAGLGDLMRAVGGGFDAAICLGNTLPHVGSGEGLLDALGDLAAVLNPGGTFTAQLLNYDLILAEGRRFLGLSEGRVGDDEYAFFRFYDFDGSSLTFNMLILHRGGERPWDWRVESTRLWAVLSTQLTGALADCGFVETRLFGNYQGDAFDPRRSGDLIAVARQARA